MRVVLILIAILILTLPAWAVVLITDSFSGGDANPIGGNWVTIQIENPLQIVSGVVRATATGGFNGSYYAMVMPDDQYAKVVTVTTVDGVGGPLVRVATNDESYYSCAASYNGTAWDLFKEISGSYTNLSADVYGFTSNTVLEVSAVGTDISCIINGVTQTTQPDGALSSGRVGLNINNSASGGLADFEFDNFEAGDFTTGIARRRIVVVR